MHITASTSERFLPFDMGYLTQDMIVKAEIELNETEDVKRKAIIELRKLLKEETDLVCKDDDANLLQYLRARKFNVERAFKLITNHYEEKKTHREFNTPDFQHFMKSISTDLISLLPDRDEDGCVIYVFQLDKWDFNETKIMCVLRDMTVAHMLCIEDPATQVCGMKVIFDITSLSLSHIPHIHPKYLYFIGKGLKNCLPVRFKEIHVVTDTTFYIYFWNILKFVMSQKIRSRIKFHSIKESTLLKHLPAELVPTKFGGTHQINNEKLLEKFSSMEHIYYEKYSYGYKSEKSKKSDGDSL